MSKVTVSVMHLARNIEGHAHDHAQILIPLQGLIFMKTGDVAYTLDHKTICIIPPDINHYYNGSPDNQVLILNFPKFSLKKEDTERLTDAGMYFMTEKMTMVKALILKETEETTSPFALDYLFYYLYDLLLSKPKEPSFEYIFANYDNPISIKELADMEHYSENYYREWFRNKTGMSPSAYIQRFRVEKAKELLLTTKYSISEIAYQVGFAHNSSFTRAFKELEGDYPRSYRKQKVK